MRVNVYAEEMTDRIEIIEKVINGQTFTGLRIYLESPVTVKKSHGTVKKGKTQQYIGGPFISEEVEQVKELPVTVPDPFSKFGGQVKGPFIHHEDDDSSAVTFWGKADLKNVLIKALHILNQHYERKKNDMGSGPINNPHSGE